jgi:hypothetical protein
LVIDIAFLLVGKDLVGLSDREKRNKQRARQLMHASHLVPAQPPTIDLSQPLRL